MRVFRDPIDPLPLCGLPLKIRVKGCASLRAQ
jgi:hypothetical protein